MLKNEGMLFKNVLSTQYFQNILRLVSKIDSLNINSEATMLQAI